MLSHTEGWSETLTIKVLQLSYLVPCNKAVSFSIILYCSDLIRSNDCLIINYPKALSPIFIPLEDSLMNSCR